MTNMDYCGQNLNYHIIKINHHDKEFNDDNPSQ